MEACTPERASLGAAEDGRRAGTDSLAGTGFGIAAAKSIGGAGTEHHLSERRRVVFVLVLFSDAQGRTGAPALRGGGRSKGKWVDRGQAAAERRHAVDG